MRRPSLRGRKWLVWLPLAIFVVIGILAPFFAPQSASETNLAEALAPPSRSHWLGTDQLGRDQLSRVIFGTQTSLFVVVAVISVSVVFGLLVGSVAGYFGGKVDQIMRILVDFAMSIPTLVLALAILGLGGGGTRNLILALAVFGWAPYARLVRNVVMANKGTQSVEASRALGASHARILGLHLLPLALRPSVVYASTDVGVVVLTGATLSFLGLGVAPPTPEWGQMLVDARPYLGEAWWMVIPPGLALGLVALGSNLVAEEMSAANGSTHLLRNVPVRPSKTYESPGTQLDKARDTFRPLYEVHNLRVNFTEDHEPIEVVRGVSFSLAPGETLGMVGTSGSGKTISALAPWGLLGAGTEIIGSAKFQDIELVGARAVTQRTLLGSKVGIVFQESKSALHPMRTVGAQLGEAINNGCELGVGRQSRARLGQNLLGQVGLARPDLVWHQYPHELSGGMRQRVMIALSLAGEPLMLIADEPTSSLDVSTQAVIVELLADLVDEANLAMLFISHNLPVVAMLAPQTVVVKNGVSLPAISSYQLLKQYEDEGLVYQPKYSRRS